MLKNLQYKLLSGTVTIKYSPFKFKITKLQGENVWQSFLLIFYNEFLRFLFSIGICNYLTYVYNLCNNFIHCYLMNENVF